MKTLFVAAALALTTLSASANHSSAQKKVSVSVTRAFKEQFGDISDVSWSDASNKMIRATFTKDGETVSAFFSADGELLASTVNVEPADLPGKTKAALAEKVKDGVITEAIRYLDDDEETYFVKIVSKTSERFFKCTSLGSVREMKF